jgi:glycosyltransferase involved in cell wall biosynthesis
MTRPFFRRPLFSRRPAASMIEKAADGRPGISVCALVPYPLGSTPSQRYRIEQWLPYLEAEGISVEFAPFMSPELMKVVYRPGHFAAKAAGMAAALARRVRLLGRLRRYDVVMIHRAAAMFGPAVIERLAALVGRPIVFDFDDAIHVLDTSPANRRLGWLKFPGKTAAICRLSSHVVVGNSYLADYAGHYNSHVSVVPSSVDTARSRPLARGVNERPVVGWTGSSTSLGHLELFAPTLREIVANYDVEIRVHCDRRPRLDGVPYVWRAWSAGTEVEEIARFDVGIMPLPDDEWTRGKCAMKALLYMSMGVPAVCSAVGANREVIEHGKNGLLASTTPEWVAAIGALAGDASLRRRLGMAGRRTVEERFSMEKSAGLFAQAVRDAHQRLKAAQLQGKVTVNA